MLKTKQVGKIFERTCVDITLDDSSDKKLATRIKSWVYGNSWGEDGTKRCREVFATTGQDDHIFQPHQIIPDLPGVFVDPWDPPCTIN